MQRDARTRPFRRRGNAPHAPSAAVGPRPGIVAACAAGGYGGHLRRSAEPTDAIAFALKATVTRAVPQVPKSTVLNEQRAADRRRAMARHSVARLAGRHWSAPALVPAAVPAPRAVEIVPAAGPTATPVIYVLKRGDNLGAVARKYKVTVSRARRSQRHPQPEPRDRRAAARHPYCSRAGLCDHDRCSDDDGGDSGGRHVHDDGARSGGSRRHADAPCDHDFAAGDHRARCDDRACGCSVAAPTLPARAARPTAQGAAEPP